MLLAAAQAWHSVASVQDEVQKPPMHSKWAGYGSQPLGQQSVLVVHGSWHMARKDSGTVRQT